jgi:hypothetical protein
MGQDGGVKDADVRVLLMIGAEDQTVNFRSLLPRKVHAALVSWYRGWQPLCKLG